MEQLPAASQLGFVETRFKTEDDVTLCGWFKPSAVKSDKTVVFSHGLGASKLDILEIAQIIQQNTDFNIFLYDFRGHGQSEFAFSTFGDKEQLDLASALTHLSKTYPEQAKEIALYGVSMGASVSLLAGDHFENVKTVVADSAYTTLNAGLVNHAKRLYRLPKKLGFMMVLGYRLRFFYFSKLPAPINAVDDYENIKAVFYIHGKRDGRIPYTESVTLKEKTTVKAALSLYDTARHIQGLSEEPERYIKEVCTFLKENL